MARLADERARRFGGGKVSPRPKVRQAARRGLEQRNDIQKVVVAEREQRAAGERRGVVGRKQVAVEMRAIQAGRRAVAIAQQEPPAHALGPAPRGVRPSISAVMAAVIVNES